MTEAEWRACAESLQLLEHLDYGGARKLRAIAVACCRRIIHLIDDPNLLTAIEAADQYLDGKITRDQLASYQKQVAGVVAFDERHGQAQAAVWCAIRPQVGWNVFSHAVQVPEDGTYEYAAYCDFIRDIFGNPFRLVSFAPEWRTNTATTIARQMYKSRDFSAMPILADALQDAGCDSGDILAHCRGASATHVRGCWVVNFMLGRE